MLTTDDLASGACEYSERSKSPAVAASPGCSADFGASGFLLLDWRSGSSHVLTGLLAALEATPGSLADSLTDVTTLLLSAWADRVCAVQTNAATNNFAKRLLR